MEKKRGARSSEYNLLPTPREKEVLILTTKSGHIIDIAESLGISMNTVKTYMKRLGNRLGTQNVLEAMMVSLESGFITEEEISDQSIHQHFSNLSHAERKLIEAMISDSTRATSNEALRTVLYRSPRTIHGQFRDIYRKIPGVSNRAQLGIQYYIWQKKQRDH